MNQQNQSTGLNLPPPAQKKRMKTSARRHRTQLLAEAGGIRRGAAWGAGGGATAGHTQSKSVTGGHPDVRAALLLDDNLHLMVHLLEAVTVHDGYTHTHKSINSLHRKPPTATPTHSTPTTFFTYL